MESNSKLLKSNKITNKKYLNLKKEEKKKKKKKKSKKVKQKIFLKYLLFSLIFIIISFFLLIIIIKKKNKIKNLVINEPILPDSDKEYIVKPYYKSPVNLSHIRFNFKNNLLNNRKVFKINYSYYPYTKINKLISYEENAENIYNLTGMLNITKLDYYYNNTDINTLNLNHIHLTMGFDSNYIDLSTISIASILNTSSSNTYIHFHILLLNCNFNDMKKIINLKKINKNVDFVFYNAIQAEYDFGDRSRKEWRGVGDYTRILAPEIVNNTNKILMMDSGDVIAQKDISEVFYFDLEDNYFSWILEDLAGNDEVKWSKFFRNYFYPNTGICLFNIRLWRKDHLYKHSILVANSYKNLPCPYQDILFVISNYKFNYMPLKYNCKQFFNTDEEKKNKAKNTELIKRWMNNQRFSPYKYSVEEIIEAATDPVINHLYQDKITYGIGCTSLTIQWINYAKMTGLFEIIKKKYPKPFDICKKLYNKPFI